METTTNPAPDRPVDPLAGLKPRVKAFVRAYCGQGHFNGTRSARLAGYKGSDESLAVKASTLLRDGKVKSAVDALLAERFPSTGELLEILRKQASADTSLLESCYMPETVDSGDGRGPQPTGRRLIDWARVRELGLGPCIRRITTSRSGETIELVDPQRAAELLGRHLGLFAERIKVESSDISQLTDEQLAAIVAGKASRSL